MIKAKVFVENHEGFTDMPIYCEVEIPAVPSRGDWLILSEDKRKEMEDTLKKKENWKLIPYYSKWFYGHSRMVGSSNLSEKNLKDFGLDDARIVTDVLFWADKDFICIELSDSLPDDYDARKFLYRLNKLEAKEKLAGLIKPGGLLKRGDEY